MPDEPTAPENAQDTPVAPESAPDEGHAPQPEAPEHDWEKRYNDLRPEFDRANQERKQYEEFYGYLTNPETAAQALAQLGIDPQQLAQMQQEEDGEEDGDPYDQRLSLIEQHLLQQVEEQQAAQQDMAVTQHIHDGIVELQGKLGREFTEKELDVLVPLCEAIPGQNGMPDVQAAYQRLYDQLLPDQQKSWLKSKRAPKVPDGQSAEQAPDLSTRQGRLAHAMNSLQAQTDE